MMSSPRNSNGHSASERDVSEEPSCWSTFKSATSLAWHYTMADVHTRPRNWCIGFVSLIIVVYFVGIVLIGTSKTPVIIFRLAEISTGEMDVLLLAEPGEDPFVNYTEIAEVLKKAKGIRGSAPRWLLKGQLQNLNDYFDAKRGKRNASEPLPTTSTNILLLDSEHETSIGIGRAWPYRQIGYSEVQVIASQLAYLNVKPNAGNRVRLFVDVKGVLEQQGINVSALESALRLPSSADFASLLREPLENDLDGVNLLDGLNLTEFDIDFNSSEATINGTAVADAIVDALLVNTSEVDGGILTPFLKPEVHLILADSIESGKGKYPSALGNVAVLDYRFVIRLLLDEMCYERTRDPFGAFVRNGPTLPLPSVDEIDEQFKLEESALLVVAVFNDRFDSYYKEMNARRRDFISITNELFLSIGLNFSGSVQYPLAVAMDAFEIFLMFLNSIFQATVVVIVFLGGLLVYTLLLTNTEERAFEIAMLRAQGMKKGQLFELLVFQSAIFIFPGVMVAMSLLFATNAILEKVLSGYTHAPARPGNVTPTSIIVPLLMGLLIPAIANAGPIRSVMSSSLRDALDIYRQETAETRVTVMKLAQLGLEPWQTLLGWFLFIGGFAVYYLIPMSFIFNELWIFFLLTNLLLLVMLFGLCLVSGAFERYIERGLLWLMLWGPDKRLWTLIVRNMGSHSVRNSKAFIMFSVSVATVIFAGVFFTLLAKSLSQQIGVFTGADLTVETLDSGRSLNRTVINDFLETQKGTMVAAWAFATFSLRSHQQIVGDLTIGSITQFPLFGHRVVGIEETFLDAAFPEFVLWDSIAPEIPLPKSSTGVPDVVRGMYSHPASSLARPEKIIYTGFHPNWTHPNVLDKYDYVIPCILASAAKDAVGVTISANGILRYEYTRGTGIYSQKKLTSFLTEIRAFADKFPGFPFITKIPYDFWSSSMLVSIPDFVKLLEPNKIDYPYESYRQQYRLPSDADLEPRYQKVFIRLVSGLNQSTRDYFVNTLQSKVDPYFHITTDTKAVVKEIEKAADLIIYFFFFASVVILLLDTFMLALVFVGNVKLNAWSFAVLRSLGFTVRQLIRSFVYESLAIVLSSFIVGTIIGILIAFTLILQLNVFMQLPWSFAFPWELFTFLLSLSVISAVVGSYLPSRSIGAKSIAQVLKHN